MLIKLFIMLLFNYIKNFFIIWRIFRSGSLNRFHALSWLDWVDKFDWAWVIIEIRLINQFSSLSITQNVLIDFYILDFYLSLCIFYPALFTRIECRNIFFLDACAILFHFLIFPIFSVIVYFILIFLSKQSKSVLPISLFCIKTNLSVFKIFIFNSYNRLRSIFKTIYKNCLEDIVSYFD